MGEINNTTLGIADQWNKVKHLKADLFIDVGAGLPKSEAWHAKNDWNCKVIGFEPQFKRYKNLINEPYFDEIYNLALSYDCKVTQYWDCDGMIQKWITDEQKLYSKLVNVVNINLDLFEFEKKYPSVFIWADIEGMELEMLDGAVLLLNSGVVTGLNLETRKKTNQYPNYFQIKQVLSEYGFKPINETSENKQDIIFIPC
jgi:FkbM family methyltransferase